MNFKWFVHVEESDRTCRKKYKKNLINGSQVQKLFVILLYQWKQNVIEHVMLCKDPKKLLSVRIETK